MNYRRYTAVEALERELEALQQEPRHHDIRKEQARRSDLRWHASGSLAGFLRNARRIHTELTEECARELLEGSTSPTASFDELRSRYLIRVVGGVVRLPRQVGYACARADRVQRSESEATARSDTTVATGDMVDGTVTADSPITPVAGPEVVDSASMPQNQPSVMHALQLIHEARYRHEVYWWLDAETARTLRDTHAVAHPQTPTLEEIVEQGWLREYACDGRDGYTLEGRAKGEWDWPEGGAHGCAHLWESILEDKRWDSDVERVRDWLDRTSSCEQFAAVGHMLHQSRQRFLDGVMQYILEESDLLGWEQEWERVQWENREPTIGWPAKAPSTLPTDGSAAARWQWWQDVEREYRGYFSDDCRETINLLLAIVILHDVSSGEYQKRYARIQQLLMAGDERPYLARVVPREILRLRPGALAWLLLRGPTSALAINLLQQIQIDPEYPDGGFEVRTESIATRRDQLYRRAVPIFLDYWLSSAVGKPHDIAVSLREAILPLARAATRRDHTSQIASQHLSVLLELYEQALFGQGAMSLSPQHHVHLAESVREPVLAIMFEESAKALSRDPDRLYCEFVVDEVRIAFWLLQMSLRHEQERDNQDPASRLSARIASQLASLQKRELDREVATDGAGKQALVRWTSGQSTVARQPWALVAAALFREGRHYEFSSPVPFGERIRAVPRVIDTVYPGQSSDARLTQIDLHDDTWCCKLRFHLQMLLCIHERLREPDHSSLALESPDVTALTAAVEDAILDVIKHHGRTERSRGALDLFEPGRITIHEDDIEPSITSTMRCVDRFAPHLRQRAVDEWLKSTRNLDILLGALVTLTWPHAHAVIQERIEGEDWNESIENTRWLPRLIHLSRQALQGGQAALARTIIDLGDEMPKNQRYEPTWRQEVSVLRLQLAHVVGDDAALEKPIADNPELEDTRRHLRALRQVDGNPEDAVIEYRRLLRARPQSAAMAINLFAAQLQVAEKCDVASERRNRLRRGLAEWERWKAGVGFSVAGVAAIDENVVAVAATNELLALRELGYHERFDTLWRGLEDRILYERQVLSQIIPSLLGRNLGPRSAELLQGAREWHGDPRGNHPDWLDKLTVELNEQEVVASHPGHLHIVSMRRTPAEDRQIWNEMLRRRADDLAYIFGETDSEGLRDFLLRDHLVAASSFVDGFETLRALDDENKYNDIFIRLLRMRLDFLGWAVADQSRGGASNPRIQSAARSAGVGERDWVILQGATIIATGEAVRTRDRTHEYVNNHIRKIDGYNPNAIEQSYLIVYVEHQNFEAYCQGYLDRARKVSLDHWSVGNVDPPRSPRQPTTMHNMQVFRGRYRRKDGNAVIYVDHLLLHVPD